MALNHHDEICIKEPTAGDNRKNPTLRKLTTGGFAPGNNDCNVPIIILERLIRLGKD